VYEVAISRRVAYVARTAGDPYAPVPALKRAADGVNANMVMFGGQSMEDIIEGSLGPRRFTRQVLAAFAGLALLLAAVGICGVNKRQPAAPAAVIDTFRLW
jgi:hypothetical protein